MTMFELKDLPSFETLSKFAKEYHNPDLEGVQTWLQVAKATSDMMLAFEANLARHGLSQTKFFVLLLLKRNPSGFGPGEVGGRRQRLLSYDDRHHRSHGKIGSMPA
ncbi:hypothetical protein [Chromobacterium subtsugae]|uniref:hypothetical protein n=1 Tax=Chromobacterium subtsugae TaxID=251747 RepID=UPI000A9015C4|nr:hypothetical protein [Chromobacterium subtsugae]